MRIQKYARVFAIVLFYCLVSWSCSRPEAARQDREEFVAPEFYRDGSKVFLMKDEDQKSFSGTILVWSRRLTSNGVEAFLKANKASGDAEVEKLIFIRDQVLPLHDEFEKVSTEHDFLRIKGLDFTRSASLREATETAISTLAKIEALNPLPADVKTRYHNVIALFCEAKIWERAVQNKLLEVTYERRPVVNGFCEDFYASSGLLQESTPDCSPTKVPKNYFDCLWKEGVLKTKLARSLYKEATLASLRALDTKLLSNNQNFGQPGRGGSFLNLRKFNLRDEKGEPSGTILAPDRPGTPDADAEDTALRGASTVASIAAEFGSKKFALISTEVLNQLGIAAQAAPILTETVELAKVLGKVEPGHCASEVLFNMPYVKESYEGFGILDAKISEQWRARAPKIFDVKIPQDLKLQIDSKQQELSSVAQKSKKVLAQLKSGKDCSLPGESETISCKVSKTFDAQVDAAKRTDVGDALLPFQLSVRNLDGSGGHIVETTVYFDKDKGRPIRTCFDKRIGDQVSCGGASFPLLANEFDQETGKIRLKFEIDSQEKLGLSDKPREGQVLYNQLPYYLTSRTLEITLYSNRLEDMHDILSGTMKIFSHPDSSEALSLGSISMRDERPSYREKQEKLDEKLKNY